MARADREYPSDWDSRRRKVYRRDNYTCQNCGRQGGRKGNAELHAHHIVPKSKGGTDQLSNLQTVCNECHDAIHGGGVAPTARRSHTSGSSTLTRNDTASLIDGKKLFIALALTSWIVLPVHHFFQGIGSPDLAGWSLVLIWPTTVFLLYYVSISQSRLSDTIDFMMGAGFMAGVVWFFTAGVLSFFMGVTRITAVLSILAYPGGYALMKHMERTGDLDVSEDS